MRVVAIGTDHRSRAGRVAGIDRVGRWFAGISLLLLVTAKACLVLFGAQQNGVSGRMDAVTADATGLVAFMHAAGPGEMHVTLVAIHANSILSFDSGFYITAIDNDGFMSGGSAAPARVFTARAVAGFALQMSHGGGRIRLLSVGCAEYAQHGVAVMAAKAGVCALVTVGLCGSGCGLD